MNVGAWAWALAGPRALGVIFFCWMTEVSPYTPNERCHFFHLFCKRLLSAYHSPNIHNAAATPAKTQRSRARASESAGVLSENENAHSLRSQWRPPNPQSSVCARPRAALPPRTCTCTGTRGSRVSGAGGRSAVEAGSGSSRLGGCPRAALVHTLLCFPKPRPRTAHSFSRARAPRAPSRARARACAGQGPPGAAP